MARKEMETGLAQRSTMIVFIRSETPKIRTPSRIM